MCSCNNRKTIITDISIHWLTKNKIAQHDYKMHKRLIVTIMVKVV
jgi:hypothetical protein